jgi:hypothetical protein
MPKRRTSKHRGAVKDFEAAWLDGDREAGFMYSLHHDFVHRELFDRAGDEENFYWGEGMQYPIPIAEKENAVYWRPRKLADRKD